MESAMMIWPARRVSQFAGLRMQLELEKSTPRSTRSSPPELLSAGMFDFADTVMMVAREQRPGALFRRPHVGKTRRALADAVQF
jgi:hypothetical protein